MASWNFNLQQAAGPIRRRCRWPTSATAASSSTATATSTSPIPWRASTATTTATTAIDGCRQDTRPFVTNCTIGSGPCIPWAGYATEMENLGSSFYNGLQVTLTQRTFKGLNFLAGYTWAHALDNATSNRSGFPQDNRTLPSGVGQWRLRHSPPFHSFHELRAAAVPRSAADGRRLAADQHPQFADRRALSASTTPSTTSVSPGNSSTAGTSPAIPNDVHWTTDPAKQITYCLRQLTATSNPRCAAHEPESGSRISTDASSRAARSSRRPPTEPSATCAATFSAGPAYANLDMSVTKRWKLSERISLQLRGEFFNILNHPNFDGLYTIGTDLSDPVVRDQRSGSSERYSGRRRLEPGGWFGRLAAHSVGCQADLVANEALLVKPAAPASCPGLFHCPMRPRCRPSFPKVRDGVSTSVACPLISTRFTRVYYADSNRVSTAEPSA